MGKEKVGGRVSPPRRPDDVLECPKPSVDGKELGPLASCEGR
jgi:hypothetical protein